MTALIKNEEFDAATSAKAGLAKGTIVLTLRGEVAVEDLREGDRVITRDIGAQPLRAVKCHKGTATIIQKDSLGKNSPERDMHVAPEQPVLLRGNKAALVSARKLAREMRECLESTTLYRLVFDRSHVIYADGAELAIA